MDKRIPTHYTLRYEHTDALHKKGECVAALSDAVSIGQQENCKVRFHNSSSYADEVFAIVRPARNGGEWLLVPASGYVRTLVNGSVVELVHYLKDGDRIAFEGEEQELTFNVHFDGSYDVSAGVTRIAAPMSRSLLAALFILPVLLFSLLFWYLRREMRAEEVRNEMFEPFEKYILQLSVDSVYYECITSDTSYYVDRYSYLNAEGHLISGTAFVSADGRIVTARHCIEPWLNDAMLTEVETPDQLTSLPSRWAIMAETYNQCNENDTIYRVVSVCNLFRGQSGTEPFGTPVLSSSFCFRTDRDDVVMMGDFYHDYYYRSIKETYSTFEMLLDDIAWTHTDSVGGIKMADSTNIEQLLSGKPRLDFWGYPDYKAKGREHAEGRLKLPFSLGERIAHNGSLVHGYSGGPVLVFHDGEFYAVGAISRIDNSGGERMYSVPVTELKNDQTQDD